MQAAMTVLFVRMAGSREESMSWLMNSHVYWSRE